MIRINLLPVRQVKKRELGRQWIVLAAAVCVLTLIVNYMWWSAKQDVVNQKQREIEGIQTRIAELEKVLSDVNNINKKKKDIQEKLNQLDDRRKSKSGPVRMMDALATATPKKVWLQTFKEAQENVDLKGSAVSLDDVAEFMKNLQNIVWTPKGIGKVVERPRDGKTVRVELVAYDGALEDLEAAKVKNFFTDVVIDNTASAIDSALPANAGRVVSFNVRFKAHYAL
jgi:type IV pilus assembly protein PilN